MNEETATATVYLIQRATIERAADFTGMSYDNYVNSIRKSRRSLTHLSHSVYTLSDKHWVCLKSPNARDFHLLFDFKYIQSFIFSKSFETFLLS